MRLIKILDLVNQFEKSSFLKIIDSLSTELRKENEEIDELFCQNEEQIKNIDDDNIVKLFNLTKHGFAKLLKKHLEYNDFHLELIIDILIRDGNAVMSKDWLYQLYDKEITQLKNRVALFLPQIDEDNKELDPHRKRDYAIYRNCVKTAYENDIEQNRDETIKREEKTILNTLVKELDLSVEEVRMIYFSIVPIVKVDFEHIIVSLKEIGIIFFNRKTNKVFVSDEMAWLLRDTIGMDLSHKYFRRILRQFKDPDINRISKKHNINLKLEREAKIRAILKQGMSVKSVFLKDLFKDNFGKKEKKLFLSELIQNKLNLKVSKLGNTYEDRIDILINYFREMEQDENIGISSEGYTKLLNDLIQLYPSITDIINTEFELQGNEDLSTQTLTDNNIKPLDILDLLSLEEVKIIAEYSKSKTRGNIRLNILGTYKDIENILLENYGLISKRDVNGLKDKGIELKESDLGIKFEDLTKTIFRELNYNVDEKLRQQINTKRSKIDILINLGNNEVLIIECKTSKDGDYNKYTSVTRQLKSYDDICSKANLRVLQIILVANDFSEDFIGDCEYDMELDLSLVKSQGLLKIMNGFKDSKLSEFPTKLFQKSGLLDDNRIVAALNR